MNRTNVVHQPSSAPVGESHSQIQSHKRSLARCEASRTRPDRPRVFDLAGLSWDLLDDVFAPIHSPSTGVALDFLGLSPSARPRTAGSRGSMLEIGCGTGVVSVVAALDGYERVVGTDINLHAVRNTELNVARHGVGDRMRVAHSDLFDSLPPGERFDVIFWSSNYVLAPEDYAYRNVCEQAFVDPGYAAHQRFLEQAVRWTTPGGRVLLHFTNRGDTGLLRRLAAECGRDLRLRESRTVREGEDAVEHLLLEVTPSAK